MADDLPARQKRWASIARESFAIGELASLLTDPIYRAHKVPRGDGRLVVLIPGLFGNDLYLWPLRRWLLRIGYRPSGSGLWMNAGCPDRLTSEVHRWIDRQEPRRDAGIVLLGHSRGGILARALAGRIGARVSNLILLGSPVANALNMARSSSNQNFLSGGTLSTLAQASNSARRILDPQCRFPQCDCGFIGDMRRDLPPDTLTLSIYSREDPIVPAQACVITGAQNVEVSGTHSGLVYNPAVYRELAKALP